MTSSLAYLCIDFDPQGSGTNNRPTEIGVIGTESDLEPLFEYATVIDPQSTVWRLPAVRMAEANGLADDLLHGGWPTATQVGDRLLALIDEYGSPDTPISLAGSGVAPFDHRLIRDHMPRLAERLTHYSLNVGPVRRLYRAAVGHDLTPVNGSKTHRALDDVRCHLEEAQVFRYFFRASTEVAA